MDKTLCEIDNTLKLMLINDYYMQCHSMLKNIKTINEYPLLEQYVKTDYSMSKQLKAIFLTVCQFFIDQLEL